MGGIRHKLRLLFVGSPYAPEQSVQRSLNALQILVMHVDPVFHGIHFEVGDRVLQVVVLCLVKRHLAELLRPRRDLVQGTQLPAHLRRPGDRQRDEIKPLKCEQHDPPCAQQADPYTGRNLIQHLTAVICHRVHHVPQICVK